MKRRAITIGALAGALVLVGGGVAFAQSRGDSGSYRTATVTTGDVDKTVNLTGTVTSSSRRDLSFGTSGTVKKVEVKAGDTVKAGAVLAALDTTDLDDAVTKATATLAKAEAQLENDQSSQSSTVAAASTPSSSSGSAGKSTGSTGSSGVSAETKAALAALKAKQNAVTSAQTDASTAITAAKAALSAQSDACKQSDDSTGDSGDPGSTPVAGLSQDCTDALSAVQAAQDIVETKQDALQKALQDLTTTLTKAVESLGKSAGTGSTPSEGSSSSTGSPAAASNGSSGSSGGSSGKSAGAAAGSLAQDQASIDTANAELTEAKLTAAAAKLTAPFAGKVLSVPVAKGDSVSTSDVAVVLVGDGATTATSTVTVDQVASVKVGQTAAVTPAGADKPVTGTVTSIGLLPDTSSDTTTYPITLDLASNTSAPEGTTASIALVIGTVKNALTVPSSAVSKTGRTTVDVLSDGTVTRTPVTVGVVGPTRTSITEGLRKGQEVILADLDAVLPSGDSATTIRGFGGGGTFGGGNFTGVRPGGAAAPR